MKKTLVVGLGNPDVPVDAIGVRIAQALAERPDLPDDVEVICAGTDLLRVADRLRDRDTIVFVDAATGSDGCSGPVFCEHGSPELDNPQHHAHHLSAVQALDLIRWSDENVRSARCYWFLPIVTSRNTMAQSAP